MGEEACKNFLDQYAGQFNNMYPSLIKVSPTCLRSVWFLQDTKFSITVFTCNKKGCFSELLPCGQPILSSNCLHFQRLKQNPNEEKRNGLALSRKDAMDPLQLSSLARTRR